MVQNKADSGEIRKKVVVFGGGGFIGSSVSDRLLRDGYELRIFEHPRVKPYREFTSSDRVEWFAGDMLSAHDVSNAVAGMDAALHLVSFTLPGSSNEDMLYDVRTNLVAALQLLNAIRMHRVRKIVFISSGGTVYGVPRYVPVNEDHPTNPLVSYGITKLAVEKYLLLSKHLYGLDPVILRVSNAYGPRQRPETAQGAAMIFLYRAMNRLPVEVWGDGSVVRDYIYVEDIAEAFAKALAYEGKQNVFNISSGIGTSLNQLLDEIETFTGVPADRRYMTSRPFDVPYNVLDNTLAFKEMGWSPQIGLQEGLSRAAAWLKSQGSEGDLEKIGV